MSQILCAAGRAISEKELDRQCEAFLKQRFGEEVDFAIEGSLASLVSDGLVRRDEQVSSFVKLLNNVTGAAVAHLGRLVV